MTAAEVGVVHGLRLVGVSGPRHLSFLAAHGRSAEVSGRIESQYEARLRASDSSVGAFGMEACGRLVGSLSWGEVVLPSGRGISGRLDTVVAIASVRGQGVGAILVAEFVRLMAERFGRRLAHLSTIAMHPGVACAVSRLGFRPEHLGATPLWQVSLRAAPVDVVGLASAIRRRRLAILRQGCLECAKHRWARPWCGERGALP